MMDYYDHDEREQKQMRHSSGPVVRIYRAGPGESAEDGGSGGVDESSGGGVDDGGRGGGRDGGSGSGNIGEDADTNNKLDYNYY